MGAASGSWGCSMRMVSRSGGGSIKRNDVTAESV